MLRLLPPVWQAVQRIPQLGKRPLWLGLTMLLVMYWTWSKQNLPDAIHAQSSPVLRISQVYGGGGNTGAPYQADFIELFNASPDPVDLTGWSVQYAAKTGTTWQVTPLNGVIIPGYGFLLIQEDSGANGAPLPTPEATGSLKLAASDGKVALVSGQTAISSPTDPAVVDFVGYGGADAAEGSPTGKLSNSSAALRKGNGCIDSNNNNADFDVSAPAPRNSTAGAQPCVQPVTDTPTPTALPTETPTVAETPTAPETPTFTETPTAVVVATLTEIPTAAPTETPTALDSTPTETPLAAVTDTPPGSDTATPLPLDTPVPPDTPLPTDTPIVPTDTPTPWPTDTLAPTATPPPTALPRLLISELLVDPKSASDANGEWIELFNSTAAAVNLLGWTLRDLGSDSHTVAIDLWIQPGQYLVLGRNGEPTSNGGVTVNYVYTTINLANSADELLLVAPNGQTVDSLAWGGATGLTITPGASLERADLADPPVWEKAQNPWPGSVGDLGSPGSGYVGPLPSATPTLTPVITLTLLPGDTPLPVTASPTSPTPAARVLISEFLADPKAVGDASGEWIELYNGGATAVNLRGWTLADLGSERHVISADLLIEPGQYLVLARNGDSTLNGGVTVNYLYSGFSLANGEDEIVLLDPNQAVVDQVNWGGTAPWSITPGAALERLGWEEPTTWSTATAAWPTSAGDLGSPGSAWVPTLPTPTPGITAPATLTATVPSPVTPGPPALVRISEFLADPQAVGDTAGEWIELYNAGETAIDLQGWTLADLGSERHTINTALLLQPGQYLLLARNGDPAANGGVTPAYLYSGLSLANGDDEILLLDPSGAPVDQVAWGGDSLLTVKAGLSYERTAWTDPAVWGYATSPWSGSAGDLGTPGATYGGAPATATPTPAVTSGPLPRLLISEFLADPQAVDDRDGEWLEIYNAATTAVNLRGWTLADLGNERHTVTSDLVIEPGQYLVLARNGDATSNGGVNAAYVYSGLALGNRQDAILLLAPGGEQVDQVMWGGDTGLTIRAGSSYERSTLTDPPQWSLAAAVWPGSTGDQGTPGAAYNPTAPPATPTGQPGLPTPSTTPLAEQWLPAQTASSLLIEEVAYQGSNEEFIALLNNSASAVDLGGWSVGDAQLPGNNEGMYALPTGIQLDPGRIFVIARNGAAFRGQYGRSADAELEASDPATPELASRRDLARGALALSDSGDEVLLIDPAGQLADAVTFANGNYAALQLSGELRAPQDYTLQAVPPARFPLVSDVRQRFLAAPARPFEARGLPLAQLYPAVGLEEGLLAVWGSLGGHSNFSRNYTAPPHYLLAAAGAQGLNFVALADPLLAPLASDPSPTLRLAAWGWQTSTDEQAVVYSGEAEAYRDQTALLEYLAASGVLAQWQGDQPPAAAGLPAFAGDASGAPGDLAALFDYWSEVGAPLLPAGNANPELPGAVSPIPRYTGLAVPQADQAGLLAALAAHRGWLTNRPGFWLTLRAEAADGAQVWMGSLLAPQNQVTLHVYGGERSGQATGFAIWQDNRPVRQLDLPPADGRWSVTLPAVPNSFLYAVATQADGDFAVTAPLRVLASASGTVLLNEVLPAPAADLNRDGVVDGNDEFIELYNPGDQPLSLVGWQLSDNTGDSDPARRFTFGVGRALNGRERLFLWRKESRINLNVENDFVRLLNPAGSEVDRIAWQSSPDDGRSISRLPDGGAWLHGAQATPGQSNRRVGQGDTGGPPAPTAKKNTETVNETTAGQAGGPPGSVAQAKLAGLEAWVEFRAVVIAPPGLYNQSIYVADPAPGPEGPLAGIGINVYLRSADYPPLQVGDRVQVRGVLKSFRGEMELQLTSADQIRRISAGLPLQPLPIDVAEIDESLEGRLVTLSGAVSSWQGENIFLDDLQDPTVPPARVTVRNSLSWKRPYVNKGQRWQVTGIVSQFAKEAPWNGGYRVLVRFVEDLGRIRE